MKAEDRNHWIYFCLGLLLVEMLLVIWSIYDHSLPVWDQACHLISGIACYDILRRPQLFSLTWYQSLLTVNSLYPPLVYVVYGLTKIFLGTGRWVDVVVHMIFLGGLFASTYGLTLLILENYSMSLLAAILACTYHHAFWFAHTDLLDLPAFAVVVFALFCFTWWQKYPSSKKAVLLGLALALACLTKHTCLAFLAPPIVIAIAQAIISKQRVKFKQTIITLLVATVALLPWMICALGTVCQSVSSIQQQHYDADTYSNLLNYLTRSSEMSMELLTVVFLISFVFSPVSVHRKMFYINVSAVGALLIMSCFRWIPSPRYTLPLLIVMAIYTAYRTISIWKQGSIRERILLSTLAVIVVIQFILSDFYPYPIKANALLDKCAQILGVPKVGQYLGAHDPTIYPLPPVDRGDGWVLSILKKNQNDCRQTLVVMPNCEEVSASTYIYLVKKEGLNLDVVSVRTWTMLGDSVNFDREQASKINWYLLKTGRQGFKLCDKKNVDEYNTWCNYVRSSGDYVFYGSTPFPDGSKLELFRKCQIASPVGSNAQIGK